MEDYHFDLVRIFFGTQPASIYLEIALRTVFLYLFTLAVIRFLGKRSAGELTVVDVVLVVALGSAVGDPMFYPEVPLLHGMLVIALIGGLQRLGLYFANQNKEVDQFLKGKPSLVVVNGEFNLEGLKNVGISKREIFQMARQKGYRNLGEIRRMYIETDDKPSIYEFEADQIRPGLQFEPPWEMADRDLIRAGSTLSEPAIAACTNCGQVAEFDRGKKVPPCPRCSKTIWSNLEQNSDLKKN